MSIKEFWLWVAAVVMVALALAVMAHAQDRDDSPEEGKPSSCDNFAKTEPGHRCACGKVMHSECDKQEPDVSTDSKCKTYCRRQNCKCMSACTTHMKQQSNTHSAE